MKLLIGPVVLLSLLPLPVVADAQPQVQRTVFVDVDLLTMEDSAIRRNQIVVIEGSDIAAISNHDGYEPRQGDRVIDGNGGVLVPGLIDTHIHIDHEQDLRMMPLYGVTSALNMRGLPWHLRFREKIRGGEVFAPDFLSAGDYLDGDPPNMLPMASVSGAEAARRTVRAQHAAGFDFVKVYSELSREQYRAICDTTRELDMAVVGHIPDAATPGDIVGCPHLNVPHGEQLFKLLRSREDAEETRNLLDSMAAAGMTLTANISLYVEGIRQKTDLEGLVSRPESEWIHPATFQPWRPRFNRYVRRDQAWVGRVLKIVEDLQQISRIAADTAQQVLVAGSDMPVPGAYPGASLIAEVEAYEEAGLDTFTALGTATVNAARLLRQLDPTYPVVGRIAPGARADLVLVAASPLQDLDVLRSPRGVMLRGRWYDESALADMRERLAASNRDVDTRVRALESAVFSGDLQGACSLFESFRKQRPNEVLFAQYAFFYFGFSMLYDDKGLTIDPEKAGKAVLLYDMYRRTYPEFHSAHHVYGLALEASGDMQAAMAAQRRALSILPDYAPALEALQRLGETP